MKNYQLGEFEEVVMLAVAVLYDNAYGVSVKKELERRLSRNISVGALQAALRRLEDKGLLKSHEGEVTQARAGRPKRYFVVTALGKRAIEHTKAIRDDLWKAIPRMTLTPKFTKQ